MEADPLTVKPVVTIADAMRDYLKDCRSRKLAESTLTSYDNALIAFREYCAARGIRDMRGLRLEDFRGHRNSRDVAATTQRKEIEHLRAFCAFSLDHDWIDANFAKKLKPPKDTGPVTLPFEPHEIHSLLDACGMIVNNFKASAERARLRARALLLLMLYGGFRVSDAVSLERTRLGADGKILMYAMKTGVPLYVKLHADCVDALRALPIESKHFLWSGKSKLTTATGSARRTVECISKIADVKARPHRFRDTFAVELLLAGEDIRTVQLLLGHESVATTEKHYAPFVKRFQDRMDSATAKLHFGRPIVDVPAQPHPWVS
jgi:site-specific recombinase XerD